MLTYMCACVHMYAYVHRGQKKESVPRARVTGSGDLFIVHRAAPGASWEGGSKNAPWATEPPLHPLHNLFSVEKNGNLRNVSEIEIMQV